jgi:hypothetical protein
MGKTHESFAWFKISYFEIRCRDRLNRCVSELTVLTVRVRRTASETDTIIRTGNYCEPPSDLGNDRELIRTASKMVRRSGKSRLICFHNLGILWKSRLLATPLSRIDFDIFQFLEPFYTRYCNLTSSPCQIIKILLRSLRSQSPCGIRAAKMLTITRPTNVSAMKYEHMLKRESRPIVRNGRRRALYHKM